MTDRDPRDQAVWDRHPAIPQPPLLPDEHCPTCGGNQTIDVNPRYDRDPQHWADAPCPDCATVNARCPACGVPVPDLEQHAPVCSVERTP